MVDSDFVAMYGKLGYSWPVTNKWSEKASINTLCLLIPIESEFDLANQSPILEQLFDKLSKYMIGVSGVDKLFFHGFDFSIEFLKIKNYI